jgi:ABC-type Fe3+-hydroxamate transport system substrate-binding protein
VPLGGLQAEQQLPRRIVSLAPSLTREIYDLNAQDLLVGVTSYCGGIATGKEIVGSPARVNLEKIISLKPQLVLASTDCNSKSDVDMLKRFGCRVKVFNACESFSCMCSSFSELGTLLGRSQKAEEVLRHIRNELDATRQAIRGGKPLKVFWQMGTDPLITVSDATFASEYIRMSGCTNVFGGAKIHYPRVNAEEVIRLDPDVILVVTQMGSHNPSVMWERFGAMSAVRNKRVHELPADLMCQPTPAMFLKGYQALVSVLFKEAP